LAPRPSTLDASFLFALGKLGQIALLERARAFEWHLTPVVRDELKSGKTSDAVDRAVLNGTINIVTVDSDDDQVLGHFAEWSQIVDLGEAEAIAVALSRDWLVALEDRQAQRQLDRRAKGRWTNTAAVLVSMVQSGDISVAEADSVFQSLDVFPGYVKRGVSSIGDFLT
jgi:predicted nucleic acid-binding protein